MNTPAHLLLGAAAFGRADRRGTLPAAMAGAMLPDLSLYLLVSWHLLIVGTSPQVVFDELYFSDRWQKIFAIDNSMILWGGLLALGLWRRWPVLIAFAGAGLLHILLDLPLHAGDGRPHFWPLSMWVFDSPISYWDSSRGALVIGPIEPALSAVAAIMIWRRYPVIGWRVAVIALMLAEIASTNVWRVFF